MDSCTNERENNHSYSPKNEDRSRSGRYTRNLRRTKQVLITSSIRRRTKDVVVKGRDDLVETVIYLYNNKEDLHDKDIDLS